MVRKLGQQLRINRSKIKETSDTNTDFDDLDGAIRSGYFLKDGLSNNEDFYYLNLLITVTAGSVDDLEWKVAEMKKLLLSQDMDVQTCSFCQEQAFLSSLPLVSLERQLYERSKRNVLTTGAASCYPFTSYEMCDDNGILLGVNKHNNSLIIVDIFDSRVYKNANIAILGTSGAGKTFTLQLMALRMRRKGIQVFIIAPLKGHEFHRACSNIGGQFISISPASQNCINIMEIRKADKSVDDLLDGPGAEKSLLAAKIQRLHTFFSLLIPDMSHEERQLLDDAMICTYGTKGITHDNASLEQPKNPGCYKEMPILGDLYEILAASPETKRLANILNRLVNGSARSFNQQTNVALDNKYIVLDISELTGDLLTVGMFVCEDTCAGTDIITRGEAADLLYALLTGEFTVAPPPILETIPLNNKEGVHLNSYLLELQKIPEPIRQAFAERGWQYTIDYEYLARLSEERNMSCIGATNYGSRQITVSSAEATVHEFGHFLDELMGFPSQTEGFYQAESGTAAVLLRPYALTNEREYFADCFVYWLTYRDNSKKMAALCSAAPKTYAYLLALESQNWQPAA